MGQKSELGQGVAEYALVASLLLVVVVGLTGALRGWAEGGAPGRALARTPSHAVTVDGGVPTWIGDAVVH